MVDLSIILPAYNEASIVGPSLRRLGAFLDAPSSGPWRTWEIILVDDGSTDGTADAAGAALPGEPRLRVIPEPVNRGKGAAVRAGVRASTGEILVMTDVDLSYGLEDIGTAVAAIRSGAGAGMVTGDRRHPDSRMDLALSALGHVVRRQILSAAFNMAVRFFFRIPWRDTQCGLKAFRREEGTAIVSRLATERFLADIEMFLIAGRLGFSVSVIPVHLTCLSDDSTVDVFRQIPRVIEDALVIKKRQLRGAYGAPPDGIKGTPPGAQDGQGPGGRSSDR